MPKSITLNEQQAEALETFCEAFDLCTTGLWPNIAAHMRGAGIEDPETSLEEARSRLRGE